MRNRQATQLLFELSKPGLRGTRFAATEPEFGGELNDWLPAEELAGLQVTNVPTPGDTSVVVVDLVQENLVFTSHSSPSSVASSPCSREASDRPQAIS